MPPPRRVSAKRSTTERSTARDVKPKPLARARRHQVSHLALSPKASQVVLDVMRKFRRENPKDDNSDIVAAVIKELTDA